MINSIIKLNGDIMDKIIKSILKKINKAGYEAFIVGGYVRDKILGIESYDIDICTNMLPEDIIKLFKLDNKIPINYGSINIKTKKYNIDITTYRKEYNYNNHKPEKIEYVHDVLEDLKRRDFTCNTLLMDKDECIIDYYNGLNDIENKVIKCFKDTSLKLSSDPLRILRAIRLSIIYDFKLDDTIIDFINNNKELINNISYYRKKEELDKILSSDNKIKGLTIIKKMNLEKILGLKYDEVIFTNDKLGIYAQIEFNKLYSFTSYEKRIIDNIRKILSIGTIDNYTLYNYELNTNFIAGEILGIKKDTIYNMYNKLPIRSKKDIKISIKSIVKLNNNCYNNINDLLSDLEINILNGKIQNNKKDILKYIRR